MKRLIKDVNGSPFCNFVVKVISMDDVHADGIVSQRVQVCFAFGETSYEKSSLI